MFEVCAEVCYVTPDFFITGNRLIEIIAPVIYQTIKAVQRNDDMINLKLLRN
jgi:hypothetical protein